jgi:hypothetical protein
MPPTFERRTPVDWEWVSREVQVVTAGISSVDADRTNDPRRVSSDKGIRGNVPGDYRARRDDRVLAYAHAADDGRGGGDPYAFLNHNGPSDGGGASLRRLEGMAGRKDVHARPNHHIVPYVEAAKVIEGAILIDEDILPDADLVATSGKKWRNQQKALVHLLPVSWQNKALISSASLKVKRFSLAVIAIARLTFASMAADSGVRL